MTHLCVRNKDLPGLIIMLLILNLITTPLFSQSKEKYIEKLEQSSNANEFNSIFSQMMTDFKKGELGEFEDGQVMDVIAIAKEKAFTELVLPAVYGWAGTMFGNGRMDKALLYFMESAELYGTQQKKLAQALACFEIALIQHKADNHEEAAAYYQKTLEFGGDSLSHRIKINCYNGFALIERSKKNFAPAVGEFKKAYHVAEVNHDTAWMGILAGNMGSIQMMQKNYDSSLYYYFRNLGFIKNSIEFENEIETYSHLGKLYLLKSDFTLSKIYLDSAVQIIHERNIKFNDFFNPMDYINETYALLYSSMGDYKKAFAYYNKFHQVAKQKLLNVNGRSLKQLESTYAFKQKNNEVELLKKINEANLLVIQQQRYIEAAFAVILLLMFVWAINAYKTGQQRKRLNKELSASNMELGRLNHIKDKLFSVLSHDLRSPIASLKSLVLFLKNGNLKNEDLKELYVRLHHQLETSSDLLESLLHWAKSELSETRADLHKVVLANVADDVALQLKSAMDEKDIHFYNNLNFHLTALANKPQVEIIFRNLIANAVKFTNIGGLINIAGKANNQSIEVYIEDNGMGMHEDEIKNLFQPGKSFSTKGTNAETGTGLGLLITKEMISKNGGNIWVSSRKQKGTVFTFTLPLAS